ncbi:Oligosaccharyltransferase PglB [hydrothermal vent metagenome]|uniref:Oligosaccharyltransferase PglB n=1 Tax=hydrothermal vent metagenome TaxID=652676 RepID=A0A1W1EKT9_9ZZZZ
MIEKLKKYEKYDIYIYILLAYLFSIAIRMIWVYQFNSMDSFYWDNQLMINTNDGYFWASGAQNLANGIYENNPRVPGAEYGIVYFTYILTQILPFSIETITLYLPAVISSLIVIPIILISKLYNRIFLGFFAGLIVSITWSYYNRTMVGYYDSDFFALVFPVFITYFLMRGVIQEDFKSIFIASLFILGYFYGYDASISVIYAMGIGFIGYMILFLRDKEYFYDYIILISVSMFNIDWRLRLVLVILLFILLYKKRVDDKRVLLFLSTVAILIFFYFGNVFGVILSKVNTYVETGVDTHSSLEFFQVHQTIREAGKIPFDTFANRISGSISTFILSMIGYLLLIYRRKEFLLFLPLLGIGLFAYMGGLRFTVYAVPIAGISLVYLFYVVTKSIDDIKIRYTTITLFVAFALYPNIKHIIGYQVPTVFNKTEVGVLNKLKSISTTKDYTLAWWDYGYPIWYYSNTNTLIDGGKHHHDNFIISEILTTSSQIEAARLSRIAVETYVDSNYSTVADTLFKNGKKGQLNVNNYLEELKFGDIKLPKKTRDIYLFLPYRMMNILPTVSIFSNLDLDTGKEKKKLLFYQTRNFSNKGGIINLGRGIQFNSTNNTITFGNGQSTKLKYFIATQMMKNGRTQLQTKLVNKNSQISLIYMKSYGSMIVVNDAMLSSTYIRLFVLENYDKNLFELVISNPYAKVYKLKI